MQRLETEYLCLTTVDNELRMLAIQVWSKRKNISLTCYSSEAMWHHFCGYAPVSKPVMQHQAKLTACKSKPQYLKMYLRSVFQVSINFFFFSSYAFSMYFLQYVLFTQKTSLTHFVALPRKLKN